MVFFNKILLYTLSVALAVYSVKASREECAQRAVEGAKGKSFIANVGILLSETQNVTMKVNLFAEKSSEEVTKDFCNKYSIEPLDACIDRYVKIVNEVQYLLYVEFAKSMESFVECYGISIQTQYEPLLTMLPTKSKAIREIAQQSGIKTICEIGFGAGYSSMALLAANPQAKVVSFDVVPNVAAGVAVGPYAADFLNSMFPERFVLVAGTPKKSVPSFRSFAPEVNCDLLLIDGSHEYEDVLADMNNFNPMAQRSGHLVMIDDVNYEGVYRAWHDFLNAGALKELFVVSESEELTTDFDGYLNGCTRSTLKVEPTSAEAQSLDTMQLVAELGWSPDKVPESLDLCFGMATTVQSAMAVGVYTFQNIA